MADEEHAPTAREPDTDSSDHTEDEAPTEEHEPVAGDTQASELAVVEVLASEIDELRSRAADRDDLLDKLQRSKADFINYQKRLQRERERWTEMAIQELVLRILPGLDDLERALGAAREDHDVQALSHGIELIQAKLLKALADDGVAPYEAQGQPFDPAFHDAVAYLDQPNVPENTIVDVLQRGYMIGDRVLRAARVVVAKGGPKPDRAADAPPSPQE